MSLFEQDDPLVAGTTWLSLVVVDDEVVHPAVPGVEVEAVSVAIT
ncbi:hypothetical protein [Dietzia aerolata]|uniref:Uncharacterized protein n=1 Tax=Dietzia aerolata TaxID=595984 RepID=A0ABV5JR02_9ACTN|nr:hypothetical protein [Dietzia aerolata]